MNSGFDSILVRLKGFRDGEDKLAISSFDSILVRLKVSLNLEAKVLKSFRFHTGSIKSDAELLWERVQQLFRFHTGSIKSFYETLTDGTGS